MALTIDVKAREPASRGLFSATGELYPASIITILISPVLTLSPEWANSTKQRSHAIQDSILVRFSLDLPAVLYVFRSISRAFAAAREGTMVSRYFDGFPFLSLSLSVH